VRASYVRIKSQKRDGQVLCAVVENAEPIRSFTINDETCGFRVGAGNFSIPLGGSLEIEAI